MSERLDESENQWESELDFLIEDIKKKITQIEPLIQQWNDEHNSEGVQEEESKYNPIHIYREGVDGVRSANVFSIKRELDGLLSSLLKIKDEAGFDDVVKKYSKTLEIRGMGNHARGAQMDDLWETSKD